MKTNKYPPKTLVSLTEVRVFAATFVDGSQKSDTRLVAMIGDHLHFLHPENVDDKVKQPAAWLQTQIREQVPAVKATAPSEMPDGIDAASLPTGL